MKAYIIALLILFGFILIVKQDVTMLYKMIQNYENRIIELQYKNMELEGRVRKLEIPTYSDPYQLDK